MSADTQRTVEQAIAAHLAKQYPDAVLSEFVVVVQMQNLSDDLSRYEFVMPETQPFHTTAGLIDVGRRTLNDIWTGRVDE